MKVKVLIVDDDPAIVDGLTSLLLLEDIESAGACDRMEGRAYGEVSRLTGLPLGSVGPLYMQAKKKMQIATSLRGTG